jgi:signal transduction histidine kinase
MHRLGIRLLMWSLLLTGWFGGVFYAVARFDPYPVEQLQRLRREAQAAQQACGVPAPDPPRIDSGRANLPPYIGRGRLEMLLWIALVAGLGAIGAWRLALPIERPLRQLAERCRDLELGQPWTSPSMGGSLGAIGQDFSLMLASLHEQDRQLREATERAQQALLLRENWLGLSYAEFRPALEAMQESLRGLAPHPYVQTMERNLDALLQLVHDLAAPPAPPQSREVELGTFVRESLAGLGERVEPADCPATSAFLDPLRTRQVLLNLVSNALKYSAHKVTVSWGPDWILVEDQGAGFDNQQVPEMIQEFRQLAPAAEEGVGLGLATASRWMELQGGRLEFDSQPGQGTRARLLFAVPF